MAIERLPPQNIEAEQSVLGSLLIDPDAIIRVSPFLRAEDFYRETHGLIYQAILDLHERREPADFVTLCDELERRARLEEVGGAAYLTSLINAVPTAIHVEYYGHIVERTAILRRLISAASQIASIAYEEAEDVDEVIDRAEGILFNVSERRIARELVPIKQLLGEYYDRIDYLVRHRDEFIGIPTGFSPMDKLLGGLQRSDLIIVAGRPGMGKTSLALSIAHNAAKKFNQRVAIFSLEMASEQVVQRLISAETGIDSQRLRLGNIYEDEWPKFIQATGLLSETAIFIDDTPAISALEMRTKARRLYAEHGLDLLIVDYLQLMRGDYRAENRVQEISFISRSLKALARELKVPLIAVSQLSRAVESRHDKHPILSDLRESGCLSGETLITRADTGERIPIQSLVGQDEPIPVWSLGEDLKLCVLPMTRVFSSGRKMVYELTTRSGRRIRASGNHPFLRLDGWVRLDELKPGDRVAMPRSVPDKLSASEPMGEEQEEQLKFLKCIGAFGAKETLAYEALMELEGISANPNLDVLPKEVWREIEHARQKRGWSLREFHAAMGWAHDGTNRRRHGVSRRRMRAIAEVLGDKRLEQLAQSDIYWDEIRSIEPLSEEEVFDATVPGTHNFIANDIIVHNSIEQDADVVMFIYRDEVYNENTEFPNIADIIVAKHRNGPTGRVPLFFRKELAQFHEVQFVREELEF